MIDDDFDEDMTGSSENIPDEKPLSNKEAEAKRKALRKRIELMQMAKELDIDGNDWDSAFGD